MRPNRQEVVRAGRIFRWPKPRPRRNESKVFRRHHIQSRRARCFAGDRPERHRRLCPCRAEVRRGLPIRTNGRGRQIGRRGKRPFGCVGTGVASCLASAPLDYEPNAWRQNSTWPHGLTRFPRGDNFGPRCGVWWRGCAGWGVGCRPGLYPRRDRAARTRAAYKTQTARSSRRDDPTFPSPGRLGEGRGCSCVLFACFVVEKAPAAAQRIGGDGSGFDSRVGGGQLRIEKLRIGGKGVGHLRI